ncbi:hypothetical protein Acr_26g0004720 [Actinidia rufa]|uniref:Uncharacterized protein n=1 Tax=Actinidia rufa TaxID=165716 RepID=A0A7J0H2E0_9ERIC|nr:hypothetical protein Acr_26g0004720 [Actinidia rufa]
MVNFALMITAELENLTNLEPEGGCDDPNFTYYIKIMFVDLLVPQSILDLNSDPSDYRLEMRELRRDDEERDVEGNITMIAGRGRPLTQEISQAGKYAPLMVFDCRGFVPVEFSFGSGWKVESIEGTKFDGVDLSGDEFAEYDENGECPVMISNLRAVFEVAAK